MDYNLFYFPFTKRFFSILCFYDLWIEHTIGGFHTVFQKGHSSLGFRFSRILFPTTSIILEFSTQHFQICVQQLQKSKNTKPNENRTKRNSILRRLENTLSNWFDRFRPIKDIHYVLVLLLDLRDIIPVRLTISIDELRPAIFQRAVVDQRVPRDRTVPAVIDRGPADFHFARPRAAARARRYGGYMFPVSCHGDDRCSAVSRLRDRDPRLYFSFSFTGTCVFSSSLSAALEGHEK